MGEALTLHVPHAVGSISYMVIFPNTPSGRREPEGYGGGCLLRHYMRIEDNSEALYTLGYAPTSNYEFQKCYTICGNAGLH